MSSSHRYIYGSNAEKIIDNPIERHKPKKTTVKNVRATRKANPEIKKSNVIYTTMLAVVIAITLTTLVTLIKVEFAVTEHANNIINLQHNLMKIKKENSKIASDIEKSVDMNEIYLLATSELGMIQPSEENIRYISTNPNAYTVQYSNIIKDYNDKSINVGDFLGFISEGW